MNIGISMEMTRKLRDTWHAALNHEWYDFLQGHKIIPLCCHDTDIDIKNLDLVILAGGNDMHDIITWRNNHYPLRDIYEHNLLQACVLQNKPTVGICRGAHYMNYVFGGTHKLMTNPYDNVEIELPKFRVTCHHSIQIDKLAPGFKVVQKDIFDVTELFVNKQTRMMGVGWHPERAVNKHTRAYILDLIKTL
jgi:gamma-glutamyl-gamma-aminobutyrate hydrolase PuuD